jgi:signal transduction histidine kinase
MVTGLDDAESRREGLTAGADDFLPKPFDASEMLLRVRNLLALRADRVELKERNARLVELQRFKDEMSALIVHDLKNPAAAATVNLDFLVADESIVGDSREVALAAREACDRMLRLLKNLLDVSRAEDHRLRLERVPRALGELVEPRVEDRRRDARLGDRRMELAISDGAMASVDTDLVGRMVENILDNAVRYTPRGGVIRVTVARRGEEVELRIGNSGVPIPVSARASVFEKYGQASAGVSHDNHGLGLYFCRIVAEAHGGRITIEEEPELPTVFVISLPACAP